MEQKFLIKTTALKLMEELYLKCDSNFSAKIDAFSPFDDNYDKELIVKASKYLVDKHYLTSSGLASENWTTSITTSGIDWVEECHKTL